MSLKEDVTTVHGEISIVDRVRTNHNEVCKCGNNSAFTLNIHGNEFEICQRCLSNIAHCVIDALE